MQLDFETQLFFFVVLIISIIVHEVAHGFAAYTLGDPTAKLAGRLTLNPIPHIDILGSIVVPLLCVLSPGGFLFGWAKPVPYNPYNLKNQRWGEAFVASAGVLTNFLLAIVFALIARFAFGAGLAEFAGLAAIVVIVNLYLGFLNLIPFPPLDGFTVLRGILPPKLMLPFRDFENHLRAGGFFTLIIFFIIFYYVLAQPLSAFVYSVFGLLVG